MAIFNVGLLDLAPFRISPPLSEDDRNNVLKVFPRSRPVRGSMIFANDQLIERDVVSEDLKKRGVIFQTASNAPWSRHADALRKYFMSTEASSARPSSPRCTKPRFDGNIPVRARAGLEIELPIRNLPLAAPRQHVGVPASAPRGR
jgi:hypothetical protein